MSRAAIPDTELLRRAKRNSTGFTELLEDADLSLSERLHALCVFLAREQRGYENPEQLKQILTGLQPDISDTELDQIVHDALAFTRDRGNRIISTSAREWEDKLCARRRELEHGVVGRHLNSGGMRLVADQPGVGKTTSVSRGLLDVQARHFLAVERHEKAVDHRNKTAITAKGTYFHRKGISQPRYDCCIESDDCEHNADNPPLMCSVYERDETDPVLQEFRRHEQVRSHELAHRSVDGVADDCYWLDHFNELEERNPEYVIGVHQHLPEFANRDVVVVDETPKIPTYQTKWPTADLGRAATLLMELSGGQWLAEWTRKLRNAIENADRHQVSLDVDPPNKSVTADDLAELKVDFNEMLLAESGVFEVSERTQHCAGQCLFVVRDAV